MSGIELVAGLFLAGGAASGAGSLIAGSKAAGATQEASRLQRQRDNLAAAKQRRDSIRAARVARGKALNAAAGQGAITSSASRGGLGSLQSQLSTNLSFLDGQNTLADQASQQLGRAQKYRAKAQTLGAVSNLAFSAASFSQSQGNSNSGAGG